MVLVVLGVVLVVLEVVLVVLEVVLQLLLLQLHGAQRQCSEQMFGTDSVRNTVLSRQGVLWDVRLTGAGCKWAWAISGMLVGWHEYSHPINLG